MIMQNDYNNADIEFIKKIANQNTNLEIRNCVFELKNEIISDIETKFDSLKILFSNGFRNPCVYFS